MAHQAKTKLSSGVLEMKFMKKSKEKCQEEAEEEKRKSLFESEIPDELIKGSDFCVMEPSFVPCEKLIYGRLSFLGMNPEIEKLMEETEQKDMDKLKRMDGISNKEMAERYTSLIGNMKKKFTTKRKWAAENVQNSDDEETSPRVNKSQRTDKPLKFKKPPNF
ncbi:hypothetical protein JTE90_001816 [Oedothorax gibbosus]|uniref:M-phase phosphoprotein 6 n=1 Tax=Oedothorax gibbosus TaxID=931172 RepID=A0AAV6TVG0_9ARAC|nr:hypothetical protein JTE90_001816 [Oedothorax gibbosus]